MLDALLSEHWYRVADLQPRLRPHLRCHRHVYRGRAWYVLEDAAAARRHRLDPAGHAVVRLLDGRRSLQQAWAAAAEKLGEDAPTQDETIRLLAALHAADLVQCALPADARDLLERGERREQSQRLARLRNPLAIRVPVLDPEPLLARLAPLARALFSLPGLLVWLAVVPPALALALMHWPALTTHMAGQAFAADTVLLALLVYLPVKALHELGHGLAVKAGGGEVREAGILVMVLLPLPYVDASASASFPSKYRRMGVAAAGVGVELLLAALALYVWLLADHDGVRAVAWNVMLVGGVSTLLFNGNPLLRFDAYYVLADWLEIPSLGNRASGYLVYLLKRWLLGLRDAVSPAEGDDERGWLLLYGLASHTYRLVLVLVIALMLAEHYPLVGAVLAAWALAAQVALPVTRGLLYLLRGEELTGQRARALAGSAAGVALLAAVALAPAPLATVAQGVLWLPEDSQLRAAGDGFVSRVAVASGAAVRAGDLLVTLEDPLVTAERRVLDARRDEALARLVALTPTDRVQAAIVRDEIDSIEADLARNAERGQRLELRAPTDGFVWLSRAEDLPDRFVAKGETLGWLLRDERATARVVVDQMHVGLVRERTASVAVRLASRPGESLAGGELRQVPAAANRLPSAALGAGLGGEVPVDPAEPGGQRTLRPVFQFDVGVPISALEDFAGARLHARFDHGSEPLARQWLRQARLVFLERLAL